MTLDWLVLQLNYIELIKTWIFNHCYAPTNNQRKVYKCIRYNNIFSYNYSTIKKVHIILYTIIFMCMGEDGCTCVRVCMCTWVYVLVSHNIVSEYDIEQIIENEKSLFAPSPQVHIIYTHNI